MIFFKSPVDERVYSTIYEVPLSSVLDVMFESKFQSLIKPDKKASQKECNKAWASIHEQIINITDTKESKQVINLEMRIELLRLKVNKITTCALGLRTVRRLLELGQKVDPFATMIDMIKTESGCTGVFNVTNAAALEADIIQAMNAANRYLLEIDTKQKELHILTGGRKGEPATYETFITTLARMSRWAKIQYRVTEITYFEFHKNLSDWRAENEAITADNRRKTRTSGR